MTFIVCYPPFHKKGSFIIDKFQVSLVIALAQEMAAGAMNLRRGRNQYAPGDCGLMGMEV